MVTEFWLLIPVPFFLMETVWILGISPRPLTFICSGPLCSPEPLLSNPVFRSIFLRSALLRPQVVFFAVTWFRIYDGIASCFFFSLGWFPQRLPALLPFLGDHVGFPALDAVLKSAVSLGMGSDHEFRGCLFGLVGWIT